MKLCVQIVIRSLILLLLSMSFFCFKINYLNFVTIRMNNWTCYNLIICLLLMCEENLSLLCINNRYKLQIQVYDATGKAIFVLFEREAMQIIGKSADYLFQRQLRVKLLYLIPIIYYSYKLGPIQSNMMNKKLIIYVGR